METYRKRLLIILGIVLIWISGNIYRKAVLNGTKLPGYKTIIQSHNKKTLYDRDYKKAVEYDDYEIAHLLLDELHASYVKDLSKSDKLIGGDSYKKTQQLFFTAQEFIYKKEISYILLNYPEDASDRIVFLLYEIPIDGECRTGLVDKEYIQSAQLTSYISACKRFNRICDDVLTIAINQGNKLFCDNVLSLYKPDYQTITGTWGGVHVGDIKVDRAHGYVAVSTNTQNAAAQRIKKEFN